MNRPTSLTLVPVGGLANRMKAIDAALNMIQGTECRLHIIWFKDKGLNCRFEELFKPFDRRHVVLREARKSDFIAYDRPRKRNGWLPRLFQLVGFDDCVYEDRATQLFYQHFDFRSWINGKNVYLASCVYFQPIEEGMPFRSFQPIDTLQKRIDEVCTTFPDRTIGIHIRRTDNVASLRESPTELFIERIRQEIDKDPDVRFYLASDSDEDKYLLKKRFGHHIMTSGRPTDRNSVKGMQDALVELFILSKTEKIIGSVKSSYSETAAQLSNIPCELLKRPL